MSLTDVEQIVISYLTYELIMSFVLTRFRDGGKLRIMYEARDKVDFNKWGYYPGVILTGLVIKHDVVDFDFLTSCVHLKVLCLKDCNNLIDLWWLRGLVRLKALDLSGCLSVRFFEGLDALIQMEDLNLSNTHVSNLNMLRNMPRLKSLNVLGCVLKDVSGLVGCKRIRNIATSTMLLGIGEIGKMRSYVDDCHTIWPPNRGGKDCIDILRKTRKLRVFSCKCSMEMINVDVLKCVSGLKVLRLMGHSSLDVGGIEFLVQLRRLDLGHVSLVDLNILSGLVRLESIMLTCMGKLVDIEALSGMDFLEELCIVACHKLVNLSALVRVKRLKRLMISSCSELRTLDTLYGIFGLTFLKIILCHQLENIDGICCVGGNLEELIVESCERLKSVEKLINLKHLKRVWLNWCPGIVDCNFLLKSKLMCGLPSNGPWLQKYSRHLLT